MESDSALAYRLTEALPGAESQAAFIVAPGTLAHEGERAIVAALRRGGVSAPIYSLQPPRSVYRGIQQCGSRWFHSVGESIERTSFGDSLWHLERFVLDRLEENASALPILIGVGEGATLALAAGSYLYDRISGLIALGTRLPPGSWWQPPEVSLDQLPVWLIATDGTTGCDAAQTARWLACRHASVRLSQCVTKDAMDVLRVGMSEWLEQYSKRENGDAQIAEG